MSSFRAAAIILILTAAGKEWLPLLVSTGLQFNWQHAFAAATQSTLAELTLQMPQNLERRATAVKVNSLYPSLGTPPQTNRSLLVFDPLSIVGSIFSSLGIEKWVCGNTAPSVRPWHHRPCRQCLLSVPQSAKGPLGDQPNTKNRDPKHFRSIKKIAHKHIPNISAKVIASFVICCRFQLPFSHVLHGIFCLSPATSIHLDDLLIHLANVIHRPTHCVMLRVPQKPEPKTAKFSGAPDSGSRLASALVGVLDQQLAAEK